MAGLKPHNIYVLPCWPGDLLGCVPKIARWWVGYLYFNRALDDLFPRHPLPPGNILEACQACALRNNNMHPTLVLALVDLASSSAGERPQEPLLDPTEHWSLNVSTK